MELSPRLRCIRTHGEAIRRMSWSPGDKVKLHVGGGILRSYTPAWVDRAAGWMDIVVHVHGNGPASAWAEALRGGEALTFLGPARSMPSQIDEHTPWALVLGDETTVGLARALTDACPASTQILGAIELAPEDRPALDVLGVPLAAVSRIGDQHGEALRQWLAETWVPPGEGVAWLSGEVSVVVELRAALLERGLSREQIRIKPYWSMRGSAHRKTVERSLVA